jgi:hypothetical protein
MLPGGAFRCSFRSDRGARACAGLRFGDHRMIDFVVWVLQNIALAPYYLFVAITNPGAWLNWSNPEAVMRFIYYGASVEFFFVIFTTFLVITALGMFWNREFLWNCVRGLEGMANVIGRTAAWAGLLMVLIQVMIVFLQRIFRVAEIELGPMGTAMPSTSAGGPRA